jgi:hypothetical protein
MAPMRKSRWLAELDAAATEKDVVNSARDFVALLTRDEVALLPRGSRPTSPGNAKDVNEWAVRLVRNCLVHNGDSSGFDLLQEVSDFFVMASARLTELQSSPKHA